MKKTLTKIPKNPKLLELVNKFSKVAEYKITIKLVVFLHINNRFSGEDIKKFEEINKHTKYL